MSDGADISQDRIRQRAIELWEERGQPAGYDAEFWLQAERELKGERDGDGATANAAGAKSGGGSDGPSEPVTD